MFRARWRSRRVSTVSSSAASPPSRRPARRATSPSPRPAPLWHASRWRTSRTSTAPSTAARGALDGDWGKTPPNERSRLLHALADALVANRKELAELEARNVGKAISSVKAELAQAVENFRFYASAIATIAGRSNPIGGSLLFYSLKEPVGVCGQIVPWNYPLMMTTWKLAPALAAGCTIVLKPDPRRRFRRCGWPSSPPRSASRRARSTSSGRRADVGGALVKHPGVEKIAFTGSTRPAARSCGSPPTGSSG